MASSHDKTLQTIANDIAQLRRVLGSTSSPNRYETAMLLRRDRTVRDGILTSEKFMRMCELLRDINSTFADTAGFSAFELPANAAESAGGDMADHYFQTFLTSAVRLPGPLTPREVLGMAIGRNPDRFLDYLMTLLDKQATVSTYVPKLLEEVSLKDVDRVALGVALHKFIKAFVAFVLAMRPTLPTISNVADTCTEPLLQHLLLPMVRHALIAPSLGSLARKASFLGIQDLPTRISIHLKDGVRQAWKNLFNSVDLYDYNVVSDGPMLKSLETILDSLDNHPDLSIAMFQVYQMLNQLTGMGSKNASVLVLMLYAVTHYVVRALFMHLIVTGDHILTGSDFDTVVDNDSGLHALLDRRPPRVLVSPEDDPELFFTFAQKAYVKVVDLHWKSLQKNWPLMNLEQKKKIRDAIQQKINERLAFDRILMEKSVASPVIKSNQQQVLKNFDFYQL